MFKDKRLIKIFYVLSIFLLLSLCILIFSLIYQGELPKIVEEINNSAIGAILTAIITVFLLSQQTSSEEIKERNSKVFEKKLEIYERFLAELDNIIQDNVISGEYTNEKSKDEIKSLIFQLANIKMHTKSENVDLIFGSVTKLIGTLEDYNNGENNILNYQTITKEIFNIVEIFQKELYGSQLGATNININDIIMDKANILLDSAQRMGRDYSKYNFKNKIYGKGRLVQAVVKDYVQNHSGITYSDLLKTFPAELHGGNREVFIRVQEAQEIVKNTGYKRHYLNEEDKIKLSDCDVVVCSQWGTGNIDNFINHVNKIGINVVKAK